MDILNWGLEDVQILAAISLGLPRINLEMTWIPVTYVTRNPGRPKE
jgi:hypothetical protein